MLNGLTLAALYFLVASGFTLVFGLMRNVNLAHGSLYPARRLCRLERRPSQRLLVRSARRRRLPVAAVVGLLLQIGDLPPHAGPGPAADDGDHRHVDRDRRPMLWIWGGKIYQFDPPRWLYRRHAAAASIKPIRPIALCCWPWRSSSASVLWLFLTRTRVGMMIRAGVDDRRCLPASGVNVQLVFAITFAIGAGLAGFAGVVGGTALSIAPGEDTRYLLASLVVVIVGGMGSVAGAAHRRAADRPGRAVRPRLRADLRRRLHLRDHGAGAGLPAAGHHGAAGMSAAWRGDEHRAAAAGRGRPPTWLAGRVPRHSSILRRGAVSVLAYPLCGARCYSWIVRVLHLQIGAQSLFLGLIALSLTFLAGYGGMVSLAQMTVAGIAGYMIAIFGTSGTPRSASAGRGGCDRRRRW